MTVYVPTRRIMYEGEDMFGVFSTRDLAFAELVRRCTLVEGGEAEVFGDEFSIDAWEVDGGAVVEAVYPEALKEAALAVSVAAPSSREGGGEG